MASKQKQAVKVIMKNEAVNTNHKMKDLNILNGFKLNIHQVHIFMFSTSQRAIPTVFQSGLETIAHGHPTQFREGGFKKKSFKLN